MTRKDYVLLAEAIRAACDDIRSKEPEECREDLLAGVSYAAEYVADVLADDNRAFDRSRFLNAAGVRS
jgi:hypothetical protein